jgi:hypothetical protein
MNGDFIADIVFRHNLFCDVYFNVACGSSAKIERSFTDLYEFCISSLKFIPRFFYDHFFE